MKDFTLTCYNGKLWISDLLSLKNEALPHNSSSHHPPKQKRFTSIFGTIVEIKIIDESSQMIVVDDGSASISCLYKLPEITKQIRDWEWNPSMIGEKTILEKSVREESTLCDTVFNDRTFQIDDIRAVEESKMKKLNSLKLNLTQSFFCSEKLNIGDIVCVHGRLYSYFGNMQIYINVIRKIEMNEELSLMMAKLGGTQGGELEKLEKSTAEGVEPITDVRNSSKKRKIDDCSINKTLQKSNSVVETQQRRKSGLMTFDTMGEAHRLSMATALSPCPIQVPVQPCLAPPVDMLATYDTFVADAEETKLSCSDDDDFIPTTPQQNKSTI